MPDNPCILGIDPGLQITGYGLLGIARPRPRVLEAGVIRTTEAGAKPDLASRVLLVYKGIVELMEQFEPRVLAVEELYSHYNHPRTAILMAHARGVVFVAAAQRAIQVVSYHATQIKKTITGNGRASKEQMQRTIQSELNLASMPQPPDVADALAVSLCHYYCESARCASD